jgi:hypothetical protein
MMLQPDNKLKTDYKWIALAFLLGIIFFWLFRGCEPEPVKVNPLKQEIKSLKEKSQDLKKDVQKKDSVRLVHVHHWHKIKLNPDSMPCDTFLKVVIQKCDTVIKYDSLTILSLKEVIKSDSLIISKQDQLIEKDSVQIAKLEKKLRFQKRLTKLAFFGGAVIGGVGGFKIKG